MQRRSTRLVAAIVAVALAVVLAATSANAVRKPPPYGATSCHYNCAVTTRAHGHHNKKDKNPSKKALKKMNKNQEKGIGKSTVTGHKQGKTTCKSGPCRAKPLTTAQMKTEKVGGITTAVPAKAVNGSVYCSWYEAWVEEMNFTHDVMWKLTQRLNYCWQYRGGQTHVIVSHTTTIHPKIYNYASFTGWRYDQGSEKLQYSHPDGTNWSLTSHVQGHFDYCPPRIWCVQTQYPYSDIDAYGSGYAELNGWGV